MIMRRPLPHERCVALTRFGLRCTRFRCIEFGEGARAYTRCCRHERAHKRSMAMKKLPLTSPKGEVRAKQSADLSGDLIVTLVSIAPTYQRLRLVVPIEKATPTVPKGTAP